MVKERDLENQEKKDILEKVKKAPCNDIFLTILKEFAGEENLEFSEEQKKPKILGKITSFDENTPPILELDYSKEGSLFLTVYRQKNLNPDVCFIGSKPGERAEIIFADYKGQREKFSLSNSYNVLLLKIAYRVAKLYTSKLEKGQ